MPTEASNQDVEAVVEAWKESVMDLTRQNKLIDFTDTKSKSLLLPGQCPANVAASICETDLRIRKDFPEGESKQLPDSQLVAGGDPETAAESLELIERNQRQYLRERGVDTLFLSLGSLRWTPREDSEPIVSPLFLLPVQVSQDPASGPDFHGYRIVYEGEPVQLNPALRKKLEVARSVSVLPDDDIDPLAMEDAFSAIEELAASFESWTLRREIRLCIFDFTNISLYEDIERNKETMLQDPLVRAIAGDPSAISVDDAGEGHPEQIDISTSSGIPELPPGDPTADSDGTAAPAEIEESPSERGRFQVLEADPTQRQAIDAAIEGEDFVLQGPPGTGKSQVIANIIAEKLALGERVLFVSEKQAALDVVKSRLEEVGIGRFCLEAHGTHATKSSVLESLESELRADRIQPPKNWEQLRAKRDGVQFNLDQYAAVLTEAPEGFDTIPYQALGIVSRLRDLPTIETELGRPLALDQSTVDAAIEQLRELENFTHPIRTWNSHPWQHVDIESWHVDTRDRMATSLDGQIEALEELGRLADTIENRFGIRLTSADQVDTVCDSLDRLAFAPRDCWSPALVEPRFYREGGDVERLAEAHLELEKIEATLEERYHSSIYDECGRELHEQLARYGPTRFIRPSYYSLKRQVNSHARNDFAPGYQELLEDARRLARYESLQDTIDELAVERRYLDPFREGAEVDWRRLRGIQDVIRLLANRQEIAFAAADGGVSNDDIDAAYELSEAIQGAFMELRSAKEFFTSAMSLEAIRVDGQPLRSMPVEDRKKFLKGLRADVDHLHNWVQFKQRKRELSDSITSHYLDNFLEGSHEPSWLADGFKKEFYRVWLNELYQETRLGEFNQAEYEHRLEAFREADRDLLAESSIAVQHAVTSRRPDIELEHAESADQVILKREIQKQRHQRPLRDLFGEAGKTIQELKPCFMVDPRTVAQSLEHGEITFDTVIFDEASQIPPAKAVSSLIRSDQVIVAGDSKQLPPTQFFATDTVGQTEFRQDLESILDEATAILPERRLSWHYRSEATELIEFSNQRYYDGRLKTFPEQDPSGDTGLHYEFVEDGVYDRGGSRTNTPEAERVVDLIEKHAESAPEQTLGVVAFSRAQEREIRTHLDRRREANATLDAFLADDNIQEEFFIKNLEVVQGDERDRIIFSVGYGPDENGDVEMNFGPLNNSGGERRLNVAISRARQQVTVVTSLAPEEITPGPTHGQGVADFKEYLRFVREHGDGSEDESRREMTASPIDPDFQSSLEADVYERLTVEGLEVDPHPPGSGYSIDLAVRDPEDPGEYVLGIECDGSAAINAESARERDRLRQQVLAERGWVVHRVWGPAWASAPGHECERILERVEELARTRDPIEQPQLPPVEYPEPQPVSADGSGRIFERWNTPTLEPRGNSIREASRQEIQEALLELVAQAAPVSETTVYREISAAWGEDRLASDLRQSLETQARYLANQGVLHLSDGFLWPPQEHFELPLREHDGDRRDIESIALEEIAKIGYRLLEHGGKMTRDDLVLETTRRLGYKRTGSRIRSRINRAIDLLTRIQAVEETGHDLRHLDELDIDEKLSRIVYASAVA